MLATCLDTTELVFHDINRLEIVKIPIIQHGLYETIMFFKTL